MTNLTELVRHPYIAGTIAHQEALDALVAEIKVRTLWTGKSNLGESHHAGISHHDAAKGTVAFYI